MRAVEVREYLTPHRVTDPATQDCSGAIQSAIEDASRASVPVVFDPIRYRVEHTIFTRQASRLIGGLAAGTSGPQHGTVLEWHGAYDPANEEDPRSGTPLLCVGERDTVVEGISTYPGTPLWAAVHISRTAAAPQTNTSLVRCLFLRSDCGVVVGHANDSTYGNYNFENMKYRDCGFIQCGIGLRIANNTGQAKKHDVYHCFFEHCTTSGIQTVRGSFHSRLCIFGSSAIAIDLGASTDIITIEGFGSERCKQFLRSAGTGAFPVRLSGGRISLSHFEGNEEPAFIDFRNGGPLSLNTVLFSYDAATAVELFQVKLSPYGVAVAQGCVFPVDAPFAGSTNVTLLGNLRLAPGDAQGVPIANQV